MSSPSPSVSQSYAAGTHEAQAAADGAINTNVSPSDEPNVCYMVTWTGGVDDPTYFATSHDSDARDKFAQWCQQVRENDDTMARIQVVTVTQAADGSMLSSITEDYCLDWSSSGDK